MSSKRPRLVLPSEVAGALGPSLDSLRSAFEVVEVESAEAARLLARDRPGEVILMPADLAALAAPTAAEGLPSGGLVAILEHIGEGVGVVDAGGALTWANHRLRQYSEKTQQRLVDTCRKALARFNQPGEASVPLRARPTAKYAFAVGAAHYEVLVSVATVDETRDSAVQAVIGLLWEVTASRQLQARIDAIDAAGSELMRIEAEAVAKLNMAERLRLLEQRIDRAARDLLEFSNYEIRLIDRETNQLELVFMHGLSPLKIGEMLYAEKDGNGISGYVAATGKSYICPDVRSDPRYRPGLDRAASSLTVPLALHNQVIGVLNVESDAPGAFDDNDRRFAQIFGRYVAMAMHILDLLVVERYTTNEQVASNLLGELSEPLAEISDQTAALRAGVTDETLREGLDRILDAAGGIRRRLESFKRGPKSLLGAEQAMHRMKPDPLMIGKRVVVADNEPTVRDAISSLLRGKGCEVSVCGGGVETIDLLRRGRDGEHRPFDLVISDIRMPDCNGYEVFRTAKEICADTPVILITGFGYDPHHSIVRANQEGLHSFLFKPLAASQLLDAVARALRGEENKKKKKKKGQRD